MKRENAEHREERSEPSVNGGHYHEDGVPNCKNHLGPLERLFAKASLAVRETVTRSHLMLQSGKSGFQSSSSTLLQHLGSGVLGAATSGTSSASRPREFSVGSRVTSPTIGSRASKLVYGQVSLSRSPLYLTTSSGCRHCERNPGEETFRRSRPSTPGLGVNDHGSDCRASWN